MIQFEDEISIVRWLLSPAGANVANEVRARAPHAPIVIELHSDGFIRVYGEVTPQEASVVIVNRPWVDTDAGERAADEYVWLQLRGRHRAAYWPGQVIATGQFSRRRPSEIEATRRRVAACERLEFLRARMGDD